MCHPTIHSFFTRNFANMASMRILEDSTSGTTPDFTAWEMLVEVEYNVDEPALGIKKGAKARLRGSCLQWWRWEGEGQWDGSLIEGESERGRERGIRGWKIVKENDYFVTLRDVTKGGEVGLL